MRFQLAKDIVLVTNYYVYNRMASMGCRYSSLASAWWCALWKPKGYDCIEITDGKLQHLKRFRIWKVKECKKTAPPMLVEPKRMAIETLNHIAFGRITETPAAGGKEWTRNQIFYKKQRAEIFVFFSFFSVFFSASFFNRDFIIFNVCEERICTCACALNLICSAGAGETDRTGTLRLEHIL